MRSCRLVDALFLCVVSGVLLVPTVGHLALATPVLAGVAGRLVLRRRHTGHRTGGHNMRHAAVWSPSGVGT